MSLPHPLTLALRHLAPGRVVDGVASIPLPFTAEGRPDLDGVAELVQRTYAAGLTPALNLFAGSVDVLSPAERADVLAIGGGVARGRRFLAGAVADADEPLASSYATACDSIVRQGGTPVLVQCPALANLDEDEVADTYRQASAPFREVVAIEADPQFGGRVYSLDLFHRLLDVPSLAGLVHATFDRVAEWYRVDARDARRPEFRLFSGNERAIDMFVYGSDYLLGAAGCAPEAFALRDHLWRDNDPHAIEVADVLQHLSGLLCRAPVQASRHAAALWLHLRSLASGDGAHPRVPRRPDGDVVLLREAAERLDAIVLAHGGRRPRFAVAGQGL
jgi:dihydrodipicolinate synthase/N-acetylneuraminate lyase